MFISKFISKVIGEKGQWRQYKARTRQLPASYRTAVDALERHRAMRSEVGGAFAGVLEEPVPDRLLRAARKSPANSSGQPRRRWSWPEWTSIAASLLIEAANRIGTLIETVLMQYPEGATPRRSSREELAAIRDRLPGYQVCVEFRNGAWLAEGRDRERTLELLSELGLPLVCVDMPQGFRSSLPPVAEVTSPDLAVVRFHGRDPKAWQKKTVTERFRYRYDEDELREWVPKVEQLAEGAREVHALMNNCYRDYAVNNAQQFMDLLKSADVPVAEPKG